MEKLTRDKIRDFNRYYTGLLGVLNHKYLGSKFSLPETRVIQAIFHAPGCSANDIVGMLNIDKGYLSRLLKKLEQQGYIVRTPAATDRRREHLTLTEEGTSLFHEIDSTADRSVDDMCAGIDKGSLSEMIECMNRIRSILQSAAQGPKEVEICPFVPGYTEDIVKLVLHFQNDGTRPLVSVDDQPDILTIEDSYIRAGGNFWIAREKESGRLAGTIGIMPYTDEIAVLKKFFVYEEFQGAPYHIGQRLYRELIDFARARNFKTILLDTPHNTTRAHKFYTRAGFRLIAEADLPVSFSHPYEDCDFFILDL